jgi:hypothetical protein
VFGCAERDSGRTFLVPVPDRTADTLAAIVCCWIEPSTTVTSDYWAAYRNLESKGFTHRSINHSMQFVDPDTGAHTNTIESKWSADKVFLGQYNRVGDYEYHSHSTCSQRGTKVARRQGLPRAIQQYNRGEDYDYHLAQYMFMARYMARQVSPYLRFFHLVANTDWDMCNVPSSTARAT